MQDAPRTSASPTPGTRLGFYEITALIGAGGMGEVFRGRDTKLNRDVAIKVLLPAVANDPDRLERFGREAQVLASLNHPNIAAIYGVEDTSEVRALIMELVEGPTLADRIARGVLPAEEVLAITSQIAEALEAAHERGIIHRDLKPANIKVRNDGTVKLLDFGLAKALEPLQGQSASASMSPTISMHATMAGILLGTAAYMSPEQAGGKPIDKRADIWAFGVVLWEMLTGRQLFQGESVSQVLAAVFTAEPDLTAVPLRFRHLLRSCLQKDPRKRLRDIGDAMSLVQDAPGVSNAAAPRRPWSAVIGWAAAGALAFVMWVQPKPVTDAVSGAPVVRFQIERLNADPYNNAARSFALSPDGKFLAHYSTDSNGRATLSVRTLATGESREVPGSAVLSPQIPFWSPDSKQVVYVTTAAAQVFNLATATARELCTCRFGSGSWNRDGVILIGSSAQHGPIRSLSLDDRTLVAVTSIDASRGERDEFPIFLPDGRRFLFTRSKPGSTPATYLGSLDEEEPRRIAEGSWRDLVAPLKGGAGHLLGINAAGLVAQPIDISTLAMTGEPVLVSPAVFAASVSGNGLLATSTRGSPLQTSPKWFDRNGKELGEFGPPAALQSVNLTPDGRTVAVTEIRNESAGIWIRDLAGANRRLSFRTGASDADPAWSPNGRRMIVSSRREAAVNLYERAANGTGEERLLFSADRNTYVNDWSRDGGWVIYTIPKGGSELDLDLWVFPMAGDTEQKPVPYLETPAREAQAEFSPDGRFVAYTSTETGDPEVYVQPFPNASQGKWLVSSGGGAEPHWSHDGKELFYVAGQTLMAVPVSLQPTFSSRPPQRLFDAPVQPWYINDSDRSQVAPNGRFLLLTASGKNTPPPIDIFVNWLELLRK